MLGVNVGQRESAAQLVDYFMEEAKVLYVVYGLWMAGFEDWLRGEGVGEAELARRAGSAARPHGLARQDPARHRGPVGGPRRGRRGRHGIRSYDVRGRRRGRGRGAACGLATAARPLRRPDGGLLAFVVRRFGEAALESCYRSVLEPHIQERYMVFDVRYRLHADTLPATCTSRSRRCAATWWVPTGAGHRPRGVRRDAGSCARPGVVRRAHPAR